MVGELSNTPANQKQQSSLSYTVEQLVAVNPYNPDILPDIENYVNEQVSSQTYSLNANLCLLRLYQVEPERMSTQIVARILIKALMAMPAPDFSLCLFLIPERVQMEEQFKTLIVLSHSLETARFRQFWDEMKFIFQKNYQVINIEGPSLDKFIDHHVANSGWTVEKNQNKGSHLVVLPPTEFNHPQLKKNTEDGIPLERIARMFPILE
ncbi:PREDICTED: eukaryotic translation initiation factor 3 subunit K-like [Erythranthe guttata]|nr:PREDICTED: eukaryotic translation initiation factor 3 subunit K-like [Erythranthe guttata]|eukprot:XP_012847978.1 PREDICTED: eukaryotic translation initiation factor 3 subunit K-like [Erythranthe guttata]